MSSGRWVMLGALFAGLGVGAGAFGAHGLPDHFAKLYGDEVKVIAGESIPAAKKYLADFITGAHYQMIHGLALVALGAWSERRPSRWLTMAGWGFVIGILLFSGSLYVLTLSKLRWLGMITPIGGVAFLVGWFGLMIGSCTASRPHSLTAESSSC